jgi:hypothetical protein
VTPRNDQIDTALIAAILAVDVLLLIVFWGRL